VDVIEPPVDSDTLQLINRRLELERRQLDIVKRFGLLFYRPYPKQDAFHRAANHKHRMYRAGNRSGKSTMGAAEDCAWLLGHRPWYKEGDSGRYIGIPQRPNKGLVITNDWDKVKEIWTSIETGKIWRLLPDGFVKTALKNHAGAIDCIVCNNGSVLRFDTVESFKKSPAGSESSDFDFIHIDEPCPEAMYKANARGLVDRNGSDWFTLTPLTELWINDKFFPEDSSQLRNTFWSEIGSTFDNPYLTPEGIAEFEATLTDDEKQCRLHGLPLELAGLVYKEFKRSEHVFSSVPHGWRAYNDPPLDHIIYSAIDPHPKTPHAVMFIAVGPHQVPIVYDEIFLHCSIFELADVTLARLRGRQAAPTRCDPIAWIEDPITGQSFAECLSSRGLSCLKASKARTFGTLLLKGVFKQPRGIRFCPTVHRTLWEIQRYCFDPKTNAPVDEDDHMMENLYRLFINNPQWHNPGDDRGAVTDEHFAVSTDAISDEDPVTQDWSLD